MPKSHQITLRSLKCIGLVNMKTKRKILKRINNRVGFLVIISLLILFAVLIPHVQAQTITMANPMGLSERDMIVYWPNGTMQGFYNSTSVISLDNTSDYIFAIKPVQTNPFEDPVDWLQNTAFPFVQSQIIGIVLIVILAALWKAR